MKRMARLMVSISMIVVVVALAGCSQAPAKPAEKSAPAMIELIPETGVNRVVLTEKAAERLNIQTDQVRMDQKDRKRVAMGEVVGFQEANAAAPGIARISVSLNESETGKVDRGGFAVVMLLDDEDEAEGVMGELDEAGDSDDGAEEGSLYYLVENTNQRLTLGQQVRVMLPLMASTAELTVVPYSAIIYDINGDTWVYTNPESLVFTRYPVVIEFIEAGQAFLVEGPPVGTRVATVGVAELYGADTGVGK